MKTGTTVSVAASLLIASMASAADILVPQDVSSIQGAIALASDGDRVLVSPGTYFEAIDFSGKNITVESVGGASETIIDGGAELGYVVTVNSGETDAVLRGFTITGGFGQAGSMGGGPGGGMLIDDATATIENSVFADNAGITGGAVTVINADVTVRGTRFEGNSAIHGGALYIEFGNLVMEGSELVDNTATNFGGAIALFWLTDATITDTQFHGNKAINSGFGGAVYANHAQIDFARLTFVENGKAQPLDDGVSWSISTGGGGAIYTTSTNGRIAASRFLRNIASFGTALYIAGSGEVQVVNSLIAENGAVCNCGTGAVYANASSPKLINCTVVGNGGFVSIYTTFNSFPVVSNSILAGQQNLLGVTNPTGGNGETSLSFTLIDGSAFAAVLGDGNVMGAAMLDAEADYAPLAGSPVIDAGDNNAVPADITTDLLGNDRFADGAGDGLIVVDMGAIEFGSNSQQTVIGDMNGDGVVNVSDLLMLLAAWGPCNGHCPADMNNDNRVDVSDLLILLAHWH